MRSGTTSGNVQACRVPECGNKLSVNNKSGFCKLHRHTASKSPHKVCSFASCDVPLRNDNTTGFCQHHRDKNAARNQKGKPTDWPMAPCSRCGAAMINANTNVGRICGACVKSRNRSDASSGTGSGTSSDTSADGSSIITGKKRLAYDYEGISFSAAAKRALTSSRLQGLPMSEDKAKAAASLLDLEPMVLHVRQSPTNSATSAFGLVTQDFVNILRDARIKFDTKEEPGTILRASLQLADDDEESASQSAERHAEIDDALTKAGYGKLAQAAGNLDGLDDDVQEMLNMDFHEKPNMLGCIAELFTHAIVLYKDALIKTITMEAYSRHASLDAHSESQASASSLPAHGKRVFCGTIPAADGKGLKHKFVIASSTMNTLCTCSVALNTDSRVEIGPGFSKKMNPKHCKLFVARSAIEKFKHLASCNNDELPMGPVRLSEIRQITSSLYHASSYNNWRRSWEPFRDVLHVPATVFTLCDLPSFSGYGSNATSVARLSSQFLAIIARARIHHDGLVTHAQLTSFLSLYDVVPKDNQNWTPLKIVVDRLKDELGQEDAVNVLQFAFFTSLSAVADVAGSSLSSANSKLASNIRERFLDLYHEN